MKTKSTWEGSRTDRRRALPKATIKKILTKIAYTPEPLPMLAKIKSEISEEFFRPAFGSVDVTGPKEVILSGYFAGGESA
jgi:hypothetical protein